MSMLSTGRFTVIAVLLAGAGAAAQAQASAQAPAPPASCAASADRHRFDFWIGEWQVTTMDGHVVGASSVQAMAGGCGLLENWTASNGTTGKSLNAYNPAVKQWQQYWVGQGGAVTEYRESEWHDGSLSLIARSTGSSTQTAPIQRLTFTPMNDSTVRQHGEMSADGGVTWTTTYDFSYHRRGS
jgi:opacity protein-like surface antigen